MRAIRLVYVLETMTTVLDARLMVALQNTEITNSFKAITIMGDTKKYSDILFPSADIVDLVRKAELCILVAEQKFSPREFSAFSSIIQKTWKTVYPTGNCLFSFLIKICIVFSICIYLIYFTL